MTDDINNRLVNYLIHKPKDQVIDRFEDYFSFLNNDEPSWVLNEGIFYPSVSVAFQGARASDMDTKQRIANVDSPDELIEIASSVEDPSDWQNRRLKVMEILIRDKFRRSLEMRERLRLTEEKQIVCRYQEESPSNLFWGVIGNKGQNQIGRILERVRADINENSDLKKWMLTKFPLQNDKILLPLITLNVTKEGELIESIVLKDRSYYYMGQYKTNSVLLAHPSISRLHACIICEEGNKVRLLDMEAKSGSFVNGEILEKLSDRELQNKDILTFALSTRSYEISIDYTKAKEELQKRSVQLQQQVKQLQRLNQPSITPEELRRIMGFSIDDTLFVSGLPDNATTLGVRKIFEEHAKVKDVKIPVDKWSGKSKGFAYVLFETQDEFSKAFLHSMKYKYGETKLKVKIADKDKSSSLMNICRIEDESDKRKRNNDSWGRKDRNERGSDRYRDRDERSKKRSSRSRSRSGDRRDKERNRNSRFDSDKTKDKERISDKEDRKDRNLKEEKNEGKDKKEKKQSGDIEKEKDKSSKPNDSKSERRKRSNSRDNKNVKKDNHRKRSDSRQNKKPSKSDKERKRRSESPKQSSSKTENTRSKKRSSKSRSIDRERDRKDMKKLKTEDHSKSKRSSSKGKKEKRSYSRDRKSRSKDRQQDKKKNETKISEQHQSTSGKSNGKDVQAEKQVDKKSIKSNDKRLSKDSENKIRKKSVSSESGSSKSSGSSSSDSSSSRSSSSSSSRSNSSSNSRSSSSSSSNSQSGK